MPLHVYDQMNVKRSEKAGSEDRDRQIIRDLKKFSSYSNPVQLKDPVVRKDLDKIKKFYLKAHRNVFERQV